MNTYTADNILYLDSIEHIRTRPSMYIGDTGLKGFHHLVYEVVDNSMDEALTGFCNEINVIINSDKSITVIDNGRGIPVDFHKKEGCSALEVVLTKIGAGGKFDKNSYKISGGLHGIGISCVNALSSLLFVKVFREGKVFFQEYSRGKSVSKVEQISQSNKPKKSGTEITFQADENIFKFKNVSYSYETIAIRLRELSFLERGIYINLIDEREISEVGIPRMEKFFSEGGLKDFILFLDKNRVPIIPEVIYISGKKEKVSIEVAMRYNHSFEENIHSYVNNIKTNEGGTHLTGFRRALTKTFKKYSLLNKEKVEFTGDDFREGITAIVSVKISHPQFEGQTKTKLGNPEVSGAVEKIVVNYLRKFIEENPRFSSKILEKVLLASKARLAAKKVRDFMQKNNSNNSISFPVKLADCSLNNPEKCEIYLVEGDSAGGTAKQGRDRNFQAILPLKGKILNVEKSLQYRAFENEEIRNIFSSLGLGIKTDNKELNLERLRYHKIIIMTDADTDGSHISTLILTFFFRYMRTLIEKGYIYIATPPLYMIKKGNRKVYAWSDREREKLISEVKKGIIVQRYKGLGEMTAEQLWDTTMNPENRTLRKVNIENLVDTDRIFSLLMGDDVTSRKKFIEMNALNATIDT
ncbi:MAG TPA: DNA topoisomerase subunit B [Candidatus Angelobacter sp.]|jgi:DNA gyrase subunit B|nr:DNA topoisomerase subunit B [Candidatus Angelobacter sp.]